MSLPSRIAAACAAFFLAIVVLVAAAASAVTAVATRPFAALWHAVVGDSRHLEREFSARQYVALVASAEDHAPTPAAAEAVAFAARRIGLPYIWGGTGPLGYDCSGLTQAAYAAAGIDIPRTATEQLRRGPAKSLSQLRPGDLVFYGNPVFAHHVAIYLGALDGAGVVLDAPRPGEVIRLDPLAADDLLAATSPAG